MNAVKHLPTVKQNVEQILSISPEARESDKLLQVQYLVMHHGLAEKLGSKFEIVRDILLHPDTPSAETIGRARRLLQAAGKFPSCDPGQRQAMADDFKEQLQNLN